MAMAFQMTSHPRPTESEDGILYNLRPVIETDSLKGSTNDRPEAFMSNLIWLPTYKTERFLGNE